MGTWGGSLYANDEAMDLRGTVRLLSKMPRGGDALLEILSAPELGYLHEDPDEATLFWYVVADQFERRGIDCPRAQQEARQRLEREPGPWAEEFEPRDLRTWLTGCTKLAERLASPRPLRDRPTAEHPPQQVLERGQVLTFPVRGVSPVNAWFRTWEEAGFEPDGWGALVVLETGRLFEWFPWYRLGALAAPTDRPLTLEDLPASHVEVVSHAVHRAVKRSHLKRMCAQEVGSVDLDPDQVAALPGEDTPTQAVLYDWSVSTISRIAGTSHRVARI